MVQVLLDEFVLHDKSQGLVRYTVVDFAEEFLKDMLFSILFWGFCKLGRRLINWSKPYLIELRYTVELIFHYCAVQLRLESNLEFFIFCLRYFFRPKP